MAWQFAWIVVVVVVAVVWAHAAIPHDNATKIALSWMQKHPLIDGHNDFPGALRAKYKGKIRNISLHHQPTLHTDIDRLKAGRVAGQFWSVFMPCKDDFSVYSDVVRDTLEQIDLVIRFTSTYNRQLAIAYSVDDLERNFRSGLISSMMGVEGGHMIDGSPAVLRLYYQLGVRYLTLTHSCHTSWADSCGPAEPQHGGLAKNFGGQMILEMNRMGMLVDISHVSHETMRQVLRLTKAPVIFSHSSAYALCPTPRNVPDDVLLMLRDTDGVVMVNFYTGFITCRSDDRGTVSDVADHVEHIARIAGWKYVGLGADFDGVDQLPEGLSDVASYPNLIAELIRRGADESKIAGLLGGNLLRVWRKVEQIRVNSSVLLEQYQHVGKHCDSNSLAIQS